MGSVSRGFRLARASWGVVKQDRELLVLPVISFFCSLVVVVVFGLGMWGIGLPARGESPSPGIYALSFVMYFVVQVLLFEPVGVGEAIKRSTSIFRQRWGEQFIGQATIGLAFFLLSIPVVLAGALLTAAVPILGVPLLVIAIGVLMAIAAACSGVFNAALYRYATTGQASGAFSVDDMNSSFRPRKGGRGL